jgi:release factor glutamine methyltransferase
MTESSSRAPGPQGPGSGSGSGHGRGDRPWTIAALLRWTVSRFEQQGLADPRLDAEHLLAFALACSRMTLYLDHDRPVDEAQRALYRELVRRRLAREPVAYIEGKRGFHALDLELAVDARVLVPRPETEHLVDWVLEDLAAATTANVIDVGTGSGAIALAIKHRRRELDVTGVDISDDALAVARANAQRLALAVEFSRSDLLAEVAPPTGGWTAIAANLPYIATDVLATLEPEVAVHEPRIALDGGPDGLDVVRRLVEAATRPGVIVPGGAIYLEIGHDQGDRVVALVRAAGLVADTRMDHARVARVVRGRTR